MSQKLIDKTYNILKEEAARGGIITYGNLYDMIGVDNRSPLDRKRGSGILTEINKLSMSEKGVMIGAIIILQDEQIPGKMFFILAAELGKLKNEASESEKADFWQQECKKVYNAYKKI